MVGDKKIIANKEDLLQEITERAAPLGGDINEVFKIKDAVNGNEAVSKAQLDIHRLENFLGFNL